MKQTQLHTSKRVGQEQVSSSGKRNQYLRAAVDFFYAETMLRVFTFVWLYWALAKFELLLQRPSILYTPINAVAEAVAPTLPEKHVFWGIAGTVALANLAKLFYRKIIWLQGLVAVGLLWINLILWGYGFLAHVNHLFLLAHLFLLFLTVERPSANQVGAAHYQTINWYYFGLLFTYSLSGLWKVAAYARKIWQNSPDVHWLKPEAALYNALVSFRDYDVPLPFAHLFLYYPWVWQIGVVLVVYLQVSAVAAAWQPALRPWMGFFLIAFHLLNQFAFMVFFVVGCFTLLCLFFPYSWLLPAYRERQIQPEVKSFQGKGLKAQYARTYSNGEQDIFTGFEAYRQRWLDRHYYLTGILYLPGVQLFVWLFMRLFRKNSPA
ncbi:MAG: hypothetical protein ACO1OQ_08535 [Rufibacter sp.]